MALHHDERMARRQLGNSMAVGMARAVGREVGRFLAAVGEAKPSTRMQDGPEGVRREGDLSGEDGWWRAGEEVESAFHRARVAAWQAKHAAEAVAALVEPVLGRAKGAWVRWRQLTGWQRVTVQELVRVLQWKRWFQLQTRAGMRAVKQLEVEGMEAARVARRWAFVGEKDSGGGAQARLRVWWSGELVVVELAA